MNTFNFYDYLPQRYVAIKSDTEEIRNLVYNFKAGQKAAAIFVASQVSSLLWKWYGMECKNITVVCCPSSSLSQYKKRFSYFSAVVSNRCMVDNAMKHVDIIGEREPLHRSVGHVVRDNDNYRINLDAEFFNGRNVIIFDDLITSGTNYITARFDDGSARRYYVNESADGSSDCLFINKKSDFIMRCKKAKSIKIEAPFYQEGIAVFNFKVDKPLKWKN